MAGCTSFLITHNLETIQLAHRVLFLENGQLVGDGTHEWLYSENASYRSLWEEGSRALGDEVANERRVQSVL